MRTLLRDIGTVSGVQSACIVRGGEVLASSFADKDAVAQAASLGFVRGVGDALEKAKRGLDELMMQFEGRQLMVVPVDKDFAVVLLANPDANPQLLRVVLGSTVRQLRRMHGLAEKPEPAPAQAERIAAKPTAPSAPGRPQPPPAQAAQTGRPAAPGRPQPARPAPPPPPLRGQQPGGRPASGAAAARPQQAPPPQTAAKPPAAKPEAAPAAAKGGENKDVSPVLPQVLALLTEYIGPVARVSFKRGVAKWRETSTPTVGTLGELAKILAADLSSDSEKKAFMDAVDKLRGG